LTVEDGRITAITTPAAARARMPGAEFIDLEAATITPGLVDAHIHLTEWAVARTQLDLSNIRTIHEAAQAVAGAPRTSGWILGRGWNPHHWGGDYPRRTSLDDVVPDIPVVLQSHDMHALWLNTPALQLTGVYRLHGDPAGGRILRDESGSPTGVLLENAAQVVVPHLPRYDHESISPLITDAQRALHRYGITGVHSFPGVYLRDPDPFPVLRAMQERGELQLRVLQHLSLDRLDAALQLGLRSGYGDDWLRVGGVKLFLDGALGSRTAWMRAPYAGSPDHGVQVMPEADFRDIVRRAARGGIAAVVHAIGDAAVALAFDVLTDEAVHVRGLPHRVEHVQCLPPDCADQLGKWLVCSVQPSHLMSDWRAADRHWGRRSAHSYAFRFMLDHGATLACGSDAPVESADPRHGLYAAVTRTDLAGEPAGGWHPEQCMTAREALAGYTTGPAYAAGTPAIKAGLAPGALADFVAWKQDPLSIEPAGLLELEPAATVVGGQIVFQN
jgi:hypothetical protein